MIVKNSLDIRDPMLTCVVAAGLLYPDYTLMLRHLLDKTPLEHIPKESELSAMQGILHSLSVVLEDSTKTPFIVKDGQEIVIPKNMGGELVHKLHATHLSYD